MLATKNVISSYSGKLHPRGIFNLYNPVHQSDERISAYNNGRKEVSCELKLRTLYHSELIKKYKN
jgi:hypothetical protein